MRSYAGEQRDWLAGGPLLRRLELINLCPKRRLEPELLQNWRRSGFLRMRYRERNSCSSEIPKSRRNQSAVNTATAKLLEHNRPVQEAVPFAGHGTADADRGS